jgi:hypothetical protein
MIMAAAADMMSLPAAIKFVVPRVAREGVIALAGV